MSARTALLTGCSSGFGGELALKFLERGWDVIATARNGPARALFEAERAAHGGRLTVLGLDVCAPSDRLAAAEAVRARGGLDLLVNNAGYGHFGALEDLSEEDLRAQFEANFFGAAFLTRALLPALRARRGRVINVSSVLGYCGLPLSAAYCASKFALEGLSECLRHELRPHGVQVALVEPGRFRTKFGDNARWGEGSKTPGSPYRAQTEAFLRQRERMSAGAGIPIGPVVAAVLRLSQARRMPLRTRVGTDARAAYWLRRLLPEGAADAAFAAICDRQYGGKQ